MNKFSINHAWWDIPKEELIKKMRIDIKKGLNRQQVEQFRKTFGSNILEEIKPTSIPSLIFEGIKEPMMILLLSIASLSLIFGKFVEAFAMIFVVAAYISVEFINKYRTDRIMMRLRSLAKPMAKVMRDGKVQEIPTADIVVGDIIILTEGSFVPADARLLSSVGLVINEASLTGESQPVEKRVDAQLTPETNLAERANGVFSGTTVMSGQGTGLVIAVGSESELGKIAQSVGKAKKEKTILQDTMTRLAKILAIFALIISALIPLIGFLRGLGFQNMVLTWLSLTFLMIPGQPPIIITMALALAAFELAKKQVIVKRLRGVEVLGQVSAIVSDKTGTITENKMKVEQFILASGKEEKALPREIADMVARALPRYSDDPTDKAVKEALEETNPEQPTAYSGFTDTQAWRDIAYKQHEKTLHAVTGNPEILIASSILDEQVKNKLFDRIKKEADQGKRVIAYASYSDSKIRKPLHDLTFVALTILHDPVRHGVNQAIGILESAGISTIIVTGDHPSTARSIGAEIGITGEIITGDQLDSMKDEQLEKQLHKSHIFARTGPLQKLRLVKLLEKKELIVAAIGDGINDAPALKTAHVGIAMGQIGTDLAKEVSDLILTDDNYAHIPDAIAIGRKALDNFKKGLIYYLSAKTILLAVFLIPLALGIPFPFAPIQIILIELLMDLASSTIFVTESAEPDIMKKPAIAIKKFLNRSLLYSILKNSIGLIIALSTIYLYLYYYHGLKLAQTAAFVTWLLGHICLAFNLKQSHMPLIKQGFLSNYFAVIWFLGMLTFSLIITCVPLFYPYFSTTWLPIHTWVIIIILIVISTFWIELKKIITPTYF